MNNEQKLLLYSHIDELARGKAPSIIPIMVATNGEGIVRSDSAAASDKENTELDSSVANNKDIVLLGSAFLIRYRGRNFLVTALHLMEEERPEGEVIALINKKIVFLDDLNFSTYSGLDIAVIEIASELLSAQVVPEQHFIEIDQETPSNGVGRYVVLGYPGSNRNRIRLRGDSVSYAMTQCHISLELYPDPLHISNLDASICFKHNEKTAVNSSGTQLGTMPPLNGMSGGPVFQIHFDAELKTDSPSRLELAGMLSRKKRIEHHGREASLALVAVPTNAICAFLNTNFFPNQSRFRSSSHGQEASD